MNAFTEAPSPQGQRAFVVVRHGGRWSDVLRLAPDQPAVIGRASSNAIAIRSHQASRQHAEIRWDAGRWWLRDLGSRNGTRVSGELIAQTARPLSDGDQIEIAGCTLTFVTRIADALAAPPPEAITRPGATDDQLTHHGLDSAEITYRLHENHYLGERGGGEPTEVAVQDAWPTLFRLAYRVASCQSVEEAAELALQTLVAAVPDGFGGVFLSGVAGMQTGLVSFVAPARRSYRPPAASMVKAIAGGHPILIRNLIDDGELQAADSRGELSTHTALLAPIPLSRLAASLRSPADPDRSRPNDSAGSGAGDSGGGYLHLYTAESSEVLTAAHLEFAAAAAGVLGAAIDSLRQRGRLVRSLRRSRRAVDSLRQRLDQSVRILGNSPPMRHLQEVVGRVAPTDATVLVRGESGVGKELVAGAIHHRSPRREGPWICLNCAALAPTLLESELFGHEIGAFTGATEQKKGKFEAADGGTLMLDEIGEMEINLQAKLLRVLEGHRFERLGGHQPLRVDVRLIAATNRDLAAEVAAGRFRADLYYRLHVIEIVVPPLRQRGEDILELSEHFVRYFADKTARGVKGLSERAKAALAAHHWPGNVRELKNVIERAVVLGSGNWLDAEDLALPPRPRAATVRGDAAESNGADQASQVDQAKRVVRGGEGADEAAAVDATTPLSLAELEHRHLVAVLRHTAGNKSRAAAILGIERSTLDRKLKRHGLGPRSYGR